MEEKEKGDAVNALRAKIDGSWQACAFVGEGLICAVLWQAKVHKLTLPQELMRVISVVGLVHTRFSLIRLIGIYWVTV